MLDQLLGQGVIPDGVLRFFIQKFSKMRLRDESKQAFELVEKRRLELFEEFKNSPIAIETDLANDQHYQVPSEFFLKVLGKNLKYSCCWFEEGDDLDRAEDRMLEKTLARAEIVDGMSILELGCGWGSVTLAMARKFPNSKITAVSNSKTQRLHIESRLEKEGLKNVTVLTENVAHLTQPENEFDRVISVEMFEHMRNYEQLLANISKWLKPSGKLFVHIFVHRDLAYKFEDNDESDWMSRHFFSGGTMPSEHLLYYFNKDLVVQKHWRVSGHHYGKTSAAWLAKMDHYAADIMEIFQQHYGPKEAKKWFHYWRLFFLTCEEFFHLHDGKEWYVVHYLLNQRSLVGQ